MSAVGEAIDKEDRPNYVQFETRAVENKSETLRQGHYVGRDVDFVLVTTPGGRDVYESKAEPWFEKKERQTRNGRLDPNHLAYYKKAYEKWKEGREIPLEGTPVSGWGAISPVQEKTILMAGIRTVEDLAKSNDEALRRLGMGGRDLVNKAKSWLNSVSDHGKVAMENAALKKDNENLRTTVESLEEKVNFLMHKMDQKPEDTIDTSCALSDSPRGDISLEDILPDDNINTVNSGTGNNNENMQHMQRSSQSEESSVLSQMSRSLYEGAQAKTLGTEGLSAQEVELPGLRERVQEKRKDNTDAMREMREAKESDASRGLQQSSGSDLVMQGVSSEPPQEFTRTELNTMYRDKFNRKANVRMTDESIKQKLGL